MNELPDGDDSYPGMMTPTTGTVGLDWRIATLHDAKMWAMEWSSIDPDAHHPVHVLELLRCPWPADTKVLARTLTTIDAFVTRDIVAVVAAANAAAAKCEPVVQLSFVLDDVVAGTDDVPQSSEELMLALSSAYASLERIPTMRDVQRRRVGLPDLSAFDKVGGFRAAVKRWRSENGVAA